MARRKHKRKVSRIVILTTDAVNAKTRQIRIRPMVARLLMLVLCCLFGGLIGYIAYEGQIWEMNRAHDDEQKAVIASLEEEKGRLEAEIESLNVKIEALSTAVNAQAETAEALQEELSQQSLPTEYPLTGGASIEEVTEGEPMVIFTATEGIAVVASAKGTVTVVEEDETYGYRIVVDHGNGFVSIYRNGGEAQVKVGDEVAQGRTLFLVGNDNKQLVYQIMKDGEYIKPTDMLSING